MSVNISIKNAVKRYGENTVIPNLTVDIKKGELFTLLGPSGCGKTTLLRMIAGFNSIEGGDFLFNDKRVNDMEPGKRNIGMVFQNYAIFPHLSVKDNVAFGLKNRKLDKDQIAKDTLEFLKLMQIEQYKDRKPENLSGGQQQRVALARALVIKPDVLLMDEPLSNLDAKLRVEMRSAIKDIQNEVGITTVYVTHDQEEAMAISDRIAVMKDGVIQHLGTPKELFQRPANMFVSTFIGRTNIFDATLTNKTVTFDFGYKLDLDNLTETEGNLKVSIRPEELEIVNEDTGIVAKVVSSIFLGLNTHYIVNIKGSDQKVEIIQESSIDQIIEKNTDVNLRIKKEKINVFSEDGSRSLIIGVTDGK